MAQTTGERPTGQPPKLVLDMPGKFGFQQLIVEEVLPS